MTKVSFISDYNGIYHEIRVEGFNMFTCTKRCTFEYVNIHEH